MNKKIIMPIAIVLLLSFVVFVSAVQMSKQIENHGTISGDFVDGDVQLSKGWNLVQGFPSPDWMFGDDIFPNNIKAIYGFNPATQEYVRFYPNPDRDELGASNIRIDTMIATSAFWVYSDKENVMEYYTLKPAPLNEKRLVSGWNFISITPDMTININTATPEEEASYVLNAMKGNCDWTEIYTYAKEAGEMQWLDLLNNPNFVDKEPLDTSLTGMGLVIKVSNDCKLGNVESSVAPPTIPN